MSFWALVFSHLAAMVGGAMVARNPDKFVAMLSRFGAWLVSLLPRKSEKV